MLILRAQKLLTCFLKGLNQFRLPREIPEHLHQLHHHKKKYIANWKSKTLSLHLSFTSVTICKVGEIPLGWGRVQVEQQAPQLRVLALLKNQQRLWLRQSLLESQAAPLKRFVYGLTWTHSPWAPMNCLEGGQELYVYGGDGGKEGREVGGKEGTCIQLSAIQKCCQKPLSETPSPTFL